MPTKKYRVKLSEVERQELKGLLNKGRLATRKQTHARILLRRNLSDGSGRSLAHASPLTAGLIAQWLRIEFIGLPFRDGFDRKSQKFSFPE